jgi:hypothetical protein
MGTSVRGLRRHHLLHSLGLVAKPLRMVGSAVENRCRLEQLELAARCRFRRFCQQRLQLSLAHRAKGARRYECLLENLHAIDTGDDYRSRQVQGIVKALDRRHGVRLENDSVPHAFHAEHTDVLLHELGENQFFKAAVVGVHDVERHLHCVELEPALLCHFEHVEVDVRVLVSGEADVTELARFARLDERPVGAVVIENAVRILVAENLVVLDQVNAVGLEATERFFDLSGRFFFRPAVDLGHQEYLLPVAVVERFAHADLAGAVVVVPAVVHEVDTTMNSVTNDVDTQLFIHLLEAEVPASETNGGYLLSRAAEDSVRHFCMHCAF